MISLFTKIYLSVRRIGLKKSLDILANTIERDIRDRSYPVHPGGSLTYLPPGKFIDLNAQPSGAILRFENAVLELTMLAEELARCSWSPASGAGDWLPPYAIAKNDWGEVPVRIQEIPDSLIVSSSRLTISIKHDGSIQFMDSGGRLIRAELPPYQTMPRIGRKGNTLTEWIHLAALPDEAAIYGLGERACELNLAGHAGFRMWNRDPEGLYGPGDDPLYLCIPVYMVLHAQVSYVIFYENSYPAVFSFGNSDPDIERLSPPGRTASARFEGGPLRYYVSAGSPPESLGRYLELTGRPPLPPRWSLGYHHSRWGYRRQEEVRAVADGFNRHQLPLSALHLDIDHMDSFKVFTADRERFPDLGGLVHYLKSLGIQTVLIVDPGVKIDPAFALFREGKERDHFCKTPQGSIQTGIVWPGWAAFPDFTKPAARRWWGEKYADLLELGVSGFWHDMNEPASFAAWGDLTLPKATRHDLEGSGGDHLQSHNLYGLLMNKAGYEGIIKSAPGLRPWMLTRSGWAGIGRYAWTWTADAGSSWDCLRQVIPSVLGLSLSGVLYAGADIGGFSGSPDPELYLRWFQLSTFLPFFRTHSSIESPSREPWTFDDATLVAIREHIQLRYRMMPYLYTLAWKASKAGEPLIRPCFWADPDDPDLRPVDDAFLLGDNLLVAPVLKPGARSRSVRLPRGQWFDYWGSAAYEGPGTICVPAIPERIPVFARGGGILPFEDARSLELNLYPHPSEESLYLLYSDAGDGYGPSRTDTIRMQIEGDALHMGWESQGEYPFPYASLTVHTPYLEVFECFIDGIEAPVKHRKISTDLFKKLRFRFKR
jgi:alpha-glucosidase